MRRTRLIIATAVVSMVVGGSSVAWFRWTLADNPLDAIGRGQYAQAAKLLKHSAETGNADAQLMLGNLYYVGLGVERHYGTASSWYQKSGMNGNASAQYNAALIYQQGLGIEKDPVTATAWFLLADAGGIPNAESYLRTLSGTLNPNSIQQAHRLFESLGREIQAKAE